MRHAIFQTDWRLYHLSLGAADASDARSLLRILCLEYASAKDIDTVIPADSSVIDIIRVFKGLAKSGDCESKEILLIEEIPLSAGSVFTSLLDILMLLITSISTDEKLHHRFSLAFTSISNPQLNISRSSPKIRERFEFIHNTIWPDSDMKGILELINSSCQASIININKDYITKESNGSPRFVKLLIRKVISGAGKDKSLVDLVEIIKSEIVS